MSRVPALIDALVEMWSADPGLNDVEVTDGPAVTDSQSYDWLLVGYDGDASGDMQAATTAQEWAGLSTSRGERITLVVAVVASRGDTDVKAARDRVYAMADVVETSLLLNPSAGLSSLQVAIESSALHQEQTANGVQARLLLTLACDTFS